MIDQSVIDRTDELARRHFLMTENHTDDYSPMIAALDENLTPIGAAALSASKISAALLNMILACTRITWAQVTWLGDAIEMDMEGVTTRERFVTALIDVQETEGWVTVYEVNRAGGGNAVDLTPLHANSLEVGSGGIRLAMEQARDTRHDSQRYPLDVPPEGQFSAWCVAGLQSGAIAQGCVYIDGDAHVILGGEDGA